MPEPSPSFDFQVRRDDLRRCRVVRPSPPEPRDGEVRVRVDRFAFTSNNVSYALAGDLLGYWRLFPAEAGWGRIPVWGFGDVEVSRHPELREGERLFGTWPMSTHALLRPGRVDPGRVVDASDHRADLPPVYNQYTRIARDPFYEARFEDVQALLWPLFMTAFLLDDMLADEGFFGARAVLLASASSKTAVALAFLLSEVRRPACEVVALTSARNADFVDRLGFYDRVIPYERATQLPEDLPVVLVDMAGNADLTGRLHRHFGEHLRHSCRVGATHWEAGGSDPGLPGPEPVFFFAPDRATKRMGDWGAEAFQERLAAAWRTFRASTQEWLHVTHALGPQAVERRVLEVLEGRARPDEGHILSLWESPSPR